MGEIYAKASRVWQDRGGRWSAFQPQGPMSEGWMRPWCSAYQDLVTRTHTDRAPVLWGLPETVFNAVSLNRLGPCFLELQPFTCYHSDCTDRPLCAAAHTRRLKLQTTSCKPSCFNESRDSICRKGEKPTFHFLYSFVLWSKIHLISYF